MRVVRCSDAEGEKGLNRETYVFTTKNLRKRIFFFFRNGIKFDNIISFDYLYLGHFVGYIIVLDLKK